MFAETSFTTCDGDYIALPRLKFDWRVSRVFLHDSLSRPAYEDVLVEANSSSVLIVPPLALEVSVIFSLF